MNAAKKIRHFIEANEQPEQVQVLKKLSAALELDTPFDLKSLYEIDMRYFDVALELLKDWRFDHHIASRSKLTDHLLIEMRHELADLAVAPLPVPVATEQGPHGAQVDAAS